MYGFALLLEKIFAYLQGKGYGAETVQRETRLALKLLGVPPTLVLDVGANKGHALPATSASTARRRSGLVLKLKA